jgi:mRNA interferase RelE/StbE
MSSKPRMSGRNSGSRLFKLRFLGKALEDLEKIDRPHQKLIKAKLVILARDPRALRNNIRKIEGAREPLYRLRVGRYRVLFRKDNAVLEILVIRIGHRKEIYIRVN